MANLSFSFCHLFTEAHFHNTDLPLTQEKVEITYADIF